VTDTAAGQVRKFPKFQTLLLNQNSNYTVQAAGATLAVTQDQFGDLIVADNTNRVGFYFPGLQGINGGNFISSYPLAPGMFASLCSPASNCDPNRRVAYFGSTTTTNGDLPNPLPLPTTLGDTQVLFNGAPAPLYYVSPSQINFYVPMRDTTGNPTPTSGTVDVTVQQRSTGRIYAAGQVQMGASSPAILMSDYSGAARQAIVVNADGTLNSPTSAAPRGSWVTIYAIGQGYIPNSPADGSPAPSSPLLSTPLTPQVNIGGFYPEEYQKSPGDPASGQFVNFSGLAPGWVGLWQINFYIPGQVSPGNNIPLLVFMGSRASNDFSQSGYRTTIAVK